MHVPQTIVEVISQTTRQVIKQVITGHTWGYVYTVACIVYTIACID